MEQAVDNRTIFEAAIIDTTSASPSPSVYLILAVALLLVCFCRLDSRSSTILATIKSRLFITEKKRESPAKPTLHHESMGTVVPLVDLDWNATEPRKIYKFNPKYFLTMGLQNTDINFITQIDRQFQERCRARREIIRTHPTALTCKPGAESMVNELYTYLVTKHLPIRFPTVYRIVSLPLQAPHLLNTVTNDILPASPPSNVIEALRSIAVNVDEDFLMLLPSADGDGYSLESAIWCYPVGFDPAEKVGMKLREAHKPVPGYKDKLESSMDRYFGRLAVGKAVYRVNWAVATNDHLYEDGEYHLYEGQEATETDVDLSNCYVRCELQTLFALPESGGRILSVHLYLYPLQQIRDEGLGEQMCEAIDGLKQGNVPGFWRYKRAPVWHEKVKEFLRG